MIDINRLDSDQLDQLAEMMYHTDAGSLCDIDAINKRKAFICGWMSEKTEAEYISAYC